VHGGGSCGRGACRVGQGCLLQRLCFLLLLIDGGFGSGSGFGEAAARVHSVVASTLGVIKHQ
jgi:hypothetical protein